jgi:hypothetical protein
MTNREAMQKIISAYTPLDYKHIDLKRTIKDNYIAAELKDNFCKDICRYWRGVNPTQLRNNMFATLKTGEDILGIIKFVLA